MAYKTRPNQRVAQGLGRYAKNEGRRMNDPARKRKEEQGQMLRLLASMAPGVGTVLGGITGAGLGVGIGAAGAGLTGPASAATAVPMIGSGLATGASMGAGLGNAAGSAAGMGMNAYADWNEEKYRREDEEANRRLAIMMGQSTALQGLA